jgi:hypothetical protein
MEFCLVSNTRINAIGTIRHTALFTSRRREEFSLDLVKEINLYVKIL